ncbi:ROK family transcriptional regulator [Streptacidiphilus griseoplanus]|uniref:ROK family transcriptional regulator n=1 Tax=Peterkaempfera griseoplana TaxID=66896 RepID=UPI0006E36594|nr:ROK family transcriptional regulator [Peterkaempfera griseoplana]
MDQRSAPARARTPLRRADIPQARPARRTSSAGTVLRAVLDHGPVARSTVARLTGLSPASVTGICTELLARGLLREAPETAGPRGIGRPHIPLDIDTGRHLVCAAHVAVPHTTLALLDLRGRVVAEERRPHRGLTPDQVLGALAARLPGLLAAHGGGERSVLGLGVATGGWVDPGSGTVVEHPLLGWRDVPVRRLLAEATGLPVHVDGHSRALVHAEQLFGETRARASVAHLFVGNVVDAAFATAGTVHHGPRSAAGAVAHLPVGGSAEPCSCGRTGCLQAAVSERTLLRRGAALGIGDGVSFAGLVALAVDGDPAAVSLFRERARLVGRAAALLLDVLNPEVLVVVEPGVSRLPQCLDDLRAEVRARSWVRRDPEHTVVVTSFPGAVLATAGGAVLLDSLYTDPLGSPPWLSHAS